MNKLIFIFVFLLSIPVFSQGEKSAIPENMKEPDAATKAKVMKSLGKIPLSFMENKGQMDSTVRFYIQGPGQTIFFTKEEVVVEFVKRDSKDSSKGKKPTLSKDTSQLEDKVVHEQRLVLRRKFQKVNPKAMVVGEEELPGKVNVFRGNDPSKWLKDIPTYKQIRYQEIYPGIDMVYRGTQGSLEYIFYIAPLKDASQIKFNLAGAKKLQLNKDGDLELITAFGNMLEKKPAAYQMVKESKVDVPCQFVLHNHELSLKLGKYDKSLPLVID